MFRIVIDPGHGQFNNPGCVKGYYEGTQMYKLAQFFMAELALYSDVQAVITRKSITENPALDVRGKMATGFDLLLSLHSNAPAVATNTGPNGVSVYDSFERRNEILAKQILVGVCSVMSSVSRGVNHRENTRDDRRGQDYYGVLRNAIHVGGCKSAMLIEHGFHTNPRECTWLMADENLKRIAKTTVPLVARHYGLIQKGDENMIYAGEYSNNVAVFQRMLMAAGFSLEPYGADKSFGPLTQKRWREFMAIIGLPVMTPISIGFIDFENLSKFIEENTEDKYADKVFVLEAEVEGLALEMRSKQDVIDAVRSIVI